MTACAHSFVDRDDNGVLSLACVNCGADSHAVEQQRRQAARPHYDTGVIAPCDRCGESDVLVVTERDYMDEPTELSCRACVEGWEDDAFEPSTSPDHLPDNDESRGHGSVR